MTNSDKINSLIAQAQKRMRASRDPMHDIRHAQCVAGYAQKIANEMGLDAKHIETLILAAWWHDVGRTVTNKPSLLWMIFVDDIISALMLWRETVKLRLFGSVAGMATRLIFCHSYGAGAILTRLLLRKRTRLLLDILVDADKLDIFSTKRMEALCNLVTSSHAYAMGYRVLSWYNMNRKYFIVKTAAAKLELTRIFAEFIIWLYNPKIQQWYIEQFGLIWVKRMQIQVRLAMKLLRVTMPLPLDLRY